MKSKESSRRNRFSENKKDTFILIGSKLIRARAIKSVFCRDEIEALLKIIIGLSKTQYVLQSTINKKINKSIKHSKMNVLSHQYSDKFNFNSLSNKK